jgi:DNA-binding CsgD family transcriptional regulator
MNRMVSKPERSVSRIDQSHTLSHQNSSSALGIVLMSSTGNLLYLNQAGWEGFQHLNQSSGTEQGALVPLVIRELCAELHLALKGVPKSERAAVGDRVKSLIGPYPVRLHAARVPVSDKDTSTSWQILVLIEPLTQPDRAVVQEAQQRFQLTAREQQVLERLTKGWTNKEIANDLGVAEATIKAFIKHLMEKMQCATRTGLVARLYRPEALAA